MSMKQLMGYDLDSVLRLAKLQRRRAAVEFIVPALGFMALGAALGVGIGLMVAPSSGRRLRQDVTDRIDQFRSRRMAKGEAKGQEKREMINAAPQG
jgi:hypothetical protein